MKPAKIVKIVSALTLLVGVLGLIVAEGFFAFVCVALMIAGFFGFIVGRFME